MFRNSSVFQALPLAYDEQQASQFFQQLFAFGLIFRFIDQALLE
jgi:hypothetical protein